MSTFKFLAISFLSLSMAFYFFAPESLVSNENQAEYVVANQSTEDVATPYTRVVPNVSAEERKGLLYPSAGELVYQNDEVQGFYFFNGVDWYPVKAKRTLWSDNEAYMYLPKRTKATHSELYGDYKVALFQRESEVGTLEASPLSNVVKTSNNSNLSEFLSPDDLVLLGNQILVVESVNRDHFTTVGAVVNGVQKMPLYILSNSENQDTDLSNLLLATNLTGAKISEGNSTLFASFVNDVSDRGPASDDDDDADEATEDLLFQSDKIEVRKDEVGEIIAQMKKIGKLH